MHLSENQKTDSIMKRSVVLYSLLLSLCFIPSLGAAEIEGRGGLSNQNWWGLHLGAYVRVPLSERFAIQTGGLLHTADRQPYWGDFWNISLAIPVYGSFRVPLNESLNLRLGVGPYFETGCDWGLGVSGEAGLEWKRYFAGVAYFQDCVKSSYKDEGFHLSFGYRF